MYSNKNADFSRHPQEERKKSFHTTEGTGDTERKAAVGKTIEIEKPSEKLHTALLFPGFFQQDVVGANGSEYKRAAVPLEGEPVFHGYRSFPSVACALYPLYPQGRMRHVLQQEFQLLIEGFLNLARQAVIAFFGRLAELILSYSRSEK